MQRTRPTNHPGVGRNATNNPSRNRFGDLFARFARSVAGATGSPWAFLGAISVTLVWACIGPAVGYSDSWQLMINTGTTIATFLMVFLIQNTQNHEARVLQLKLDELIRALTPARTELVNMETMSDSELEQLQKEFETVQAQAARSLEKIATSRKSPMRPAQKHKTSR